MIKRKSLRSNQEVYQRILFKDIDVFVLQDFLIHLSMHDDEFYDVDSNEMMKNNYYIEINIL